MGSRRQKALRDKIKTRNFFNQGEPSTRSSSAEQSHSHATSLTTTTSAERQASMYSLKTPLIETDHMTVAENLRAKVYASWKAKNNSLPTEEREKVHTAIKESPLILDPQALHLVDKQLEDLLPTADKVPWKKTFDLADLDQVAEEYDKLCQNYERRAEGQMATLAKTISKSASFASDSAFSTEDRLAAELDVLNLKIDSKITVPLFSCLRQVQLFNVEKSFGFHRESYQTLIIEDSRKQGEDVPAKLPPSFRQMLNDPFKPTELAPEPRQKKGEKKLSGLEALAQLQRNLKLASEEIKDLKATNDKQDFENLPYVPPTFTYAGVPIPEEIPDHVRQYFWDADFALKQIDVLIDEASEQRLKAHSTLQAWNSASQDIWYVHFEVITPIELVDRMPTQFFSQKTTYRFELPP